MVGHLDHVSFVEVTLAPRGSCRLPMHLYGRQLWVVGHLDRISFVEVVNAARRGCPPFMYLSEKLLEVVDPSWKSPVMLEKDVDYLYNWW